ncbi:MAG TPA: hypothetical protein VE595_01800 [Nitrososphaeraceae archaeon]|nr:hypothetical protein [Nitrososphaeraceae archaeon]
MYLLIYLKETVIFLEWLQKKEVLYFQLKPQVIAKIAQLNAVDLIR